jgi:D-3-phosphoglycerate dehydrogenase / 2-oxoglutarate reductase
MADIDILITEEAAGEAIEGLKARWRVEQAPELWRETVTLRERAAGVRALMVRNQTQVDAALLAAAGRLEVIGRIGVGMDNIDVPAVGERGIVLCYAAEENAVSVAEHVFALLLALARKVPQADRSVRRGEWERAAHMGFELHGKTMAVLGLGRIGLRVALRARAFGMRVVAYDPLISPSSPAVTESGAVLLPLAEALAAADVVSLHLPLTAETRGLLTRERLRGMKPGAVLVNTARGALLDEPALAAALAEGRLGGAALDVRALEPPGDSPLHCLENVILSPHIASWTHEATARVLTTVAADVERVLRGEPAQQFWNFAGSTVADA